MAVVMVPLEFMLEMFWVADGGKTMSCVAKVNAPAGNRTRGLSMATTDFTTKPLALASYVLDRSLKS